jgi:hypothetical protein
VPLVVEEVEAVGEEAVVKAIAQLEESVPDIISMEGFIQ